MRYVITGISSGLGKYLHENLPGSLGIDRDNYFLIEPHIKNEDIIIHCAFNKTNDIKDYNNYLDDNIFFTKKLLELGNRMIYISSIDVYLQNNIYSLFKKFSEALVHRYPNNLVLRCPALIGEYMKPNHLHKLKENKSIGLSGESTFNYILYSDVLENVKTDIVGTYELISKENTNINTIKKLFKSNTELGEYLYATPTQFKNPIKIKRTSIETIKKYFI